VAVGVLRSGVPRYERSVELAGRMGDRRVDHDARTTVAVEVFPEGPFADVGRVHDVPVVAVEREEAEHAVLAGIHAGVERGPRAGRPRRNLGLQRPGSPRLEHRFEVRNRVRLEQRVEYRPAPGVQPDQYGLHIRR
jgi:hypothetical protein